MAFATDWDEIRWGVRLNLLFGLALLMTQAVFFQAIDFSRSTAYAYVGGTVILTVALLIIYFLQERSSRPAV
jgi:hypothetical protein